MTPELARLARMMEHWSRFGVPRWGRTDCVCFVIRGLTILRPDLRRPLTDRLVVWRSRRDAFAEIAAQSGRAGTSSLFAALDRVLSACGVDRVDPSARRPGDIAICGSPMLQRDRFPALIGFDEDRAPLARIHGRRGLRPIMSDAIFAVWRP